MLRCAAEPWGFGEPSEPRRPWADPDSGDMRGDAYMGGVSGFTVCPDIGGL